MTTSTTDAEAIRDALGVLRIKWRGHDDARIDDASIDEAVTAILSYLASRREAQEPILQYRVRHCADWYDGHPDPTDGKDYETRAVYTTPPSPAPAGEVERLVKPIIDRLEWNGRLQQWVVRPDLPAGTINAVRVALNGGRSE